MSLFSITFILLVLSSLLLELYLLTLNKRELKRLERNDESLDVPISLEDGERQKTARYNLAKILLARVDLVIGSVLLLAAVLFAWPSGVESVVSQFHAFSPGSLLHDLVFLLAVGFVFLLFDIPLSLHRTFSLEERFGFNRVTLLQWFKDFVLGLILSAVFASIAFVGVLYALQIAGDLWWIAAGLLLMFFQFVGLIIFPTLIAPLFNKFSPVEDEILTSRFREMAETAGLTIRDVLKMDASKRSAHANAYFTGFGGTKRVVLFDTLLEKLDADELSGVIAHELTHASRGHLKKSFLFSGVLMFTLLWLSDFLRNSPQLYAAFGFDRPSDAIFLMFLVYFASPFVFFLTPVFHLLSRKFEYEADEGALQYFPKAGALRSALLKLTRESLGNPVPHHLYSSFHYSHPTLRERLEFLRGCEAKLESS